MSFPVLSAWGVTEVPADAPKRPRTLTQPLQGSPLQPWGAQLLTPALPLSPSPLLLLCFFLLLLV